MRWFFILKRTLHYKLNHKYLNVRTWRYAMRLAIAEWESK